MKSFMLCLLNMLLLVCGQMLFKLAARGRETSSIFDVVKLILLPHMIAAVVIYAGATLLWVYILTKIPISFAYPIQALAFPLVIIFSSVFFKESIPLHRWFGVGIIVFGALLASK